MNSNKYRFWFLFVFLHVVFFGAVYLYLPFYVTLSLFLGEMGLVAVLNPKQILSERFEPFRRTVGYAFLVFAILIELSFLSHFPLWLWLVPAMIYAPFFLLKPLAAHKRKALWICLSIGFIYLGWMFYKIYPRFQNPAEPLETPSIPAPLPRLPMEAPPPSLNEPPPASTSGPLTNAIQEIDLKLKALEDENRQLKEKISSLEQEQTKAIKERDQKIESLNQKLEEIRKLVQL